MIKLIGGLKLKKGMILGILVGFIFSHIFFSEPLTSVFSNSNAIKHTFNNQLNIQLPHSTRVIESNIIERGQLLYSVYLDDQTLLTRGYIQLWNLDDLKNYLQNSKRISSFDINSYTLKPIEVGDFNGYLTQWTASFGESYKISGIEYWLKKSDTSNVLRMSFFTDSSTFSEEQFKYIDKIIASIDWNN